MPATDLANVTAACSWSLLLYSMNSSVHFYRNETNVNIELTVKVSLDVMDRTCENVS